MSKQLIDVGVDRMETEDGSDLHNVHLTIQVTGSAAEAMTLAQELIATGTGAAPAKTKKEAPAAEPEAAPVKEKKAEKKLAKEPEPEPEDDDDDDEDEKPAKRGRGRPPKTEAAPAKAEKKPAKKPEPEDDDDDDEDGLPEEVQNATKLKEIVQWYVAKQKKMKSKDIAAVLIANKDDHPVLADLEDDALEAKVTRLYDALTA